ncbi:MAG: zf-HC2 domain-containing protein [Acidobacteriota bacterium]
MSREHDLEALQRAFATVPDDARPRPDCPAPEQLWLAVRGELSPSALREVVLHVAECPVCTESWRLAQMLEAETEGDVLPFSSPRRSRTQRFVWLAAALLLLALAVPFVLRDALFLLAPSGDPSSGVTVERSARAYEIQMLNESTLPRDAFRLQWRLVRNEPASSDVGVDADERVDNDVRFDIQVSPQGSLDMLVDVRDVEQLELLIEPSRLEALAAGTVLNVRIEALDPLAGRLDAATFAVTLGE